MVTGPTSLAAALALLAWPSPGSGDDPGRSAAVRAGEVRPGALRIDGALAEPEWSGAPGSGGFMQSRPAPGQDASLLTEFRVLADDEALYVAVRLLDPEPARITRSMGRRDDENVSDWCFVEIDSRHDRRSASSFGVNPSGVQVDGAWYDDVVWDGSWNAVWEAAARVDEDGWTAEFRIPFSALPFGLRGDGEPLVWGLNVYRYNPRTGEASNWSPRGPQLAGIVSRFRELVLPAPARVRRLDVTPYLLGQLAAERPGTVSAPAPPLRAGADLRAGLGPTLALSATVLPDFGQVEADPAQLNLTAFELFQAERRPFFTEGVDAFQFDTSLPLSTRGSSFAEEAPFYSRRIGRAPRGALPAGARLVEAPEATDLVAAVKLAGRSADGWRLGLLAAWTGAEEALLEDGGTSLRWPVEPTALSAVARASREREDGGAGAGLFVAGLHRPDLGNSLAGAFVRDAWTAGADGRLRLGAGAYEARVFLLGSLLAGDPAAIRAVAVAPWHGLDRTDAPRLRVDPGARALAGAAAEARLARVEGAFQWSLAARTLSPRFDMNELGFQRNSDWHLLVARWQLQSYPGAGWLRSWTVGTDNAGAGISWGGELRAAVVDLFGQLDLAGFWDLRVTLQHELASLATDRLRGGPALLLPPRETAKLLVHTDTRRATAATLEASAASEPGSGSSSWSVSPSATLRVHQRLLFTVGASYQEDAIGWQWVSTQPAAGGDLWWVARVRQRTASASLQADLAFSPRLVLQVHAQPFATSGRYDRWARVSQPRADRPSARVSRLASDQVTTSAETVTLDGPAGAWPVARPDGVQRSVAASAVIRWEYGPGSFLTAVWTHRAEHEERGPALSMGDLLEPGSDRVMVKLSWRYAP